VKTIRLRSYEKPMTDIVALFQYWQPYLAPRTRQQFRVIVCALLAMPGRVTMLGLSRWAGPGGSYRSVQRCFYTVLPWATLMWVFFRQHLQRADDVYLLAGDEVVVSKAGSQTYGLDRFFAGLQKRVIPGLAFFTLALVSTRQRRSFPVHIEQVVRSAAEKAASQAPPPAAERRKPGRPRGSKTNRQAAVVLTPELQRIQAMLRALLERIAGNLSLTYLVLDGHFGHHPALQMVGQCGLELISKLRRDAALYLPAAGPYAGRGPRRKYGAKLDYQHLPAQYLKRTTSVGLLDTRIYQMRCWHKEFRPLLNVVVIVKTNRQTQAQAHIILFSSDLTLAAATLIDYYGLRFQIEFNFRDAKQYWGLEDFMNIQSTAVTNASNLALFMVSLSHRLLDDLRPSAPACSVLDLKALYRGTRYATEALNLLPEKPEPVSMARIFSRLAALGRIHGGKPAPPSP
jgi:putative transposase